MSPARKAPAKAEPEETPTPCEHVNTVWNNGQTFCTDCGARV